MESADMPSSEQFTDLQPQQYVDIYGESDAPLSDVRRSALRIVVYTGVGLALLFTVLSAVITIPRHLSFPFVLKGSTQETIYRFPDKVYIDAIHVEPGMSVRKGERLASVTSPHIASLITAYTDALRRRENFERAELPLYEAKKRGARLEEARAGAELERARKDLAHTGKAGVEDIRALEAEAEQAARARTSSEELLAAGSVAELDAKGAEAKERAAQGRLGAARARVDQERSTTEGEIRRLGIDRAIAAESVASLDAEIAQRRSALDDDVAAAYDALALTYGSFRLDGQGLDLIAPSDATVTFIFEGDRELPEGGMLLKLMARESDLYAAVSAPADLIGFIEAGEASALKVATFPHYRWGLAHGRVSSVALTPDEKGAYPIRIAIDDPGAMRSRLHSGMTGELSIVVEEQTLAALLFEKIAKTYHGLVD